MKIRPAKPSDCAVIYQFICELAIYEKALDQVHCDEAALKASLFNDAPDAVINAFALILEEAGVAIGYAVYFFNYSTWEAKNGLY